MKTVQDFDTAKKPSSFGFRLANVFAKKSYAEIDTKVAALIDTMNSAGVIQTVASCQGHELQGKAPYVYFNTSTEIAAKIESTLRQSWADKCLNDYWTIQGLFNDRCELNFLLFAPAHDKRSASLFKGLSHLWCREKLDADLKLLKFLVSQALAEIRQNREPKIHSPRDYHN